VVVGVLEEPGVHLHLPRQHRLQPLGHVVPGRDLAVALGQHRLGRHHAQLLLPGQDLLAQGVPAGVEATPVLVRPLRGHVVRRVRGTGCVVDEERLVRCQGLLLPDPPDRPVGHVLSEVVPLLRGLRRLNRRGALVDRRVVLVGLAAYEAVEVLEAATARGPGVERTDRAGLPHRHLVALAELCGRVAVEPQGLGKGRAGVGPHRAVARGRGGQLGDDAHPDGVVVAAGEQRGSGRCTQRRAVEAVVLQPGRGQTLRRWRMAGPAERAGRRETHVIEEHHQHVGGTRRRLQRHDRRKARRRVLRVERERPVELPVGHRNGGAVQIGHDLVPSG
jgi:hypothetical protein